MADRKSIRVAVNGYGVIGKRVAAAVALQEATSEHASRMRAAGLEVAGTLDDLLGQADVVVDCTPKQVAGKNIDGYCRLGLKFIVQGGEKHEDRADADRTEAGQPAAAR